MKIIGITGPSGSGKSMLSEYIQKAGIPTIDADALYHSMLIPPSRCLDKIAEVFGSDVLSSDGTLNRSILSSRVFSNPSQLKKLNSTVLPIVIDETKKRIALFEQKGATHVAVDAPTLIESGFYLECDLIIAVLAPSDIRVSRICARDGISQQKAKERISAQNTNAFYTSVADIVMINDSDEKNFMTKSLEIIKKIRSL